MLNDATKQFIRKYAKHNVPLLALQAKTCAIPGIDWNLALAHIAGKQAIEHKIPSWYNADDLLYPARLALEQCSSEVAARYKASLLSGDSFVDLTGGWGVDTAFIAEKFQQAAYVEKQETLADIARHNFTTLGLIHIKVYAADGIGFLGKMKPVDCIYLDPARRSNTGGKIVRIEDCDPNIVEIQDQLLEKAGIALIKLSPMLDIHAGLQILKNIWEVHVVSVENECKELLFLLRKNPPPEPSITCVNFGRGFRQTHTFLFSEEKKAAVSYTSYVQAFLYEPNTSLLKAGCYKKIGIQYKVDKLHPDSHLYTSSRLISNFPGRIFRTEAIVPFKKNDLQTLMSSIKQANISVRNFPLSVDEIRKKLHLKEGGEIFLFATTLSNGQRVIIQTQRERRQTL